MHVTRVQSESGSHIEPACDQSWPELKKLRWNAAVVSMDTGLRVMVHEFPTNYCISIGNTSMAISGYRETSNYLSGISTGAEQYARQIAPSIAAQAKAEAWDEGAVAAWERSTPTVNGTHYNWRHAGLPLNPYRAATIESEPSPGGAA